MSSVVPIYGLATLHETLHDFSDDEEVKKLQHSCDCVRKRITDLSDSIHKMFEDLNSYNAQLIAEIKELNEQAEAIRASIRANIKKNSRTFDDLDQEFVGTESYTNDSKSFTDDDFEFFYTDTQEPDSPDEDEELVALFRRIAAKTHPDKTPDPAMHVLFIRAKELRKQRDLEGMRSLYAQVLNNNTEDLERKRQIEKLKEELAQLDTTLYHLKNSSDYALYKLYAQNRYEVLRTSKAQLTERRDRLYRTLESLRYATDEKAPPTIPFLTIIRG